MQTKVYNFLRVWALGRPMNFKKATGSHKFVKFIFEGINGFSFDYFVQKRIPGVDYSITIFLTNFPLWPLLDHLRFGLWTIQLYQGGWKLSKFGSGLLGFFSNQAWWSWMPCSRRIESTRFYSLCTA